MGREAAQELSQIFPLVRVIRRKGFQESVLIHQEKFLHDFFIELGRTISVFGELRQGSRPDIDVRASAVNFIAKVFEEREIRIFRDKPQGLGLFFSGRPEAMGDFPDDCREISEMRIGSEPGECHGANLGVRSRMDDETPSLAGIVEIRIGSDPSDRQGEGIIR